MLKHSSDIPASSGFLSIFHAAPVALYCTSRHSPQACSTPQHPGIGCRHGYRPGRRPYHPGTRQKNSPFDTACQVVVPIYTETGQTYREGPRLTENR